MTRRSQLDREPGEPLVSPTLGAYEQPTERLRAGSRRGPGTVALIITTGLALAVWQPWAAQRAATAVSPNRPSASSPRTVPGLPPASAAPASYSSTADPEVFVSITDNEWTVVALLAPAAAPSTEEPSIQHPAAGAWSPDGPFLVLQQGLIPVASPIEDAVGHARDPARLCVSTTVPRDRTVVPVPRGRVAYLGVTIPGSVPRPAVSTTVLGNSSVSMSRAISPTVELQGMGAGRRFVMPSTGPGGVVLFTAAPSGPLPSDVYRFTVASPGPVGTHYLYACVPS